VRISSANPRATAPGDGNELSGKTPLLEIRAQMATATMTTPSGKLIDVMTLGLFMSEVLKIETKG
jgi:hypothetical protein